ncbi:MAG: SpoIID/LytB domain-containing protein [Bacilli bacterium]
MKEENDQKLGKTNNSNTINSIPNKDHIAPHEAPFSNASKPDDQLLKGLNHAKDPETKKSSSRPNDNLRQNTLNRGNKGVDPSLQNALQKVNQKRSNPLMNAINAKPLGVKPKAKENAESEEESASETVSKGLKNKAKSLLKGKKNKTKGEEKEEESKHSMEIMTNALKKVPISVWLGIGGIASFIIVLFVVITYWLSPLLATHSILNNIGTAFSDLFETIGSIFGEKDSLTMKNEDAYYKELKSRTEYYEAFSGSPLLDTSLVTATLFYSKFGGDEFSKAEEADGLRAKPSIDKAAKLMILAHEHLYVGCAESSSVSYSPSENDKEAIAANKKTFDIGKVSTLTYKHITAYSVDEEGNKTCNTPENYVTYTVDNERKGIYYYNLLHEDFLDNYYSEFLNKNSVDYEKKKKDLVDGIFVYYNTVKKLIGNSSSSHKYGATCSFKVGNNEASDIKVKLLQCGDGSRGQPIAGEELVDFEKYVLGVVYAENGGGATEALKTQAVTARTYALTRGKQMGGAANLGLKFENGKWILSIRNCTEDQVYCDPDKGCWSNSKSASGTVHSGSDKSKSYSREPLASDSIVRSAVASVSGEVLVDKKGELVVTPYTSVSQNAWNSDAKAGMSYFAILQKYYGDRGASELKSNCVLTGGGNFQSWRQADPVWGSIQLGSVGGTNMSRIGCMVTSYAIMIAKSGTMTTISDFNPGTFANAMKNAHAFTSGGGFTSSKYKEVAPNLDYIGSISLMGTQTNKFNAIKNYADKGYEMVIQAKCIGNGCSNGQHWVAFDHIEGNNIYIIDPASSNDLLWPTYDYRYTLRVNAYKRND